LARKILLADDSVTAQNMGRRILSDAGYDVITVNNGSAALKRIAESKPDLIVLDVYMPGYGGLEVCQRLREAPETARIPVLLTVGKLEPFKAEEARRVRADGFIVKPFEASELLTALTRLEDKIVPQSQPAKPSRFAKALAGADDAASGKEFGDSDTGWKSRLSIPPPHSKHRESAPKETSAGVASFREAAKPGEHKPAQMKSGLEEAMLSSMPADVTAEEIAAIKAAAAAFIAPVEEWNFKPQLTRDQPQAPIQERVAHAPDVKTPDVKEEDPRSESVASAENSQGAVTFASGAEQTAATARENIPAVMQAESSATPEETPLVEDVSPGEVPAETAPPPAAMVSESPARVAPWVTTAGTGKLGNEEVNAALAALAPGNGHGDTVAIEKEAKSELAAWDRVPVTMAAAVAAQEFSGPRWIAESVTVTEDEASLVLGLEMEKAYAAFAAADAARMSFTSPPEEPYPSMAMAEVSATHAETASPAAESFSNSDHFEPKSQESMSPAGATGSEESKVGEAELNTASPMSDAVGERAVPGAKESAAYAAAAAAGPSPEATTPTESFSRTNSRPESSESAAPAPASGARHGESELAAAWANWRQIRASVVGSQIAGSQLSGSELVSQVTDSAPEMNQDKGDAWPQSQADDSSAAGDESREIANIVDSVLADLKPKLMAEIARKMGKEKKK